MVVGRLHANTRKGRVQLATPCSIGAASSDYDWSLWCDERLLLQAEPVVRMYDILRAGDAGAIAQADLKSMMAGILLSHPGLECLQDTPEFQDRYAETVILRIFYCLDKSGLGRITLRDLKQCAGSPSPCWPCYTG